MNMPLSAEQLATLSVPLPPSIMTRTDKLERWASLVEQAMHNMYIFHRLEYMSEHDRNHAEHPYSAFAVASADRVLQDAGLAGPTVGDAKRFFELDDAQLHAFSCDCSGTLSNRDMARRIRGMTAGDQTRKMVGTAMLILSISTLTGLGTVGFFL